MVNTVYYAPLNADVTVGTWNTTTTLPNSLYDATSVVNNGYIYEIGGVNSTGVAVNTVYYGALTPSPSNNTTTNTSSSSSTTSSNSTTTSAPKTPDTGYGEPIHISSILTLLSISSIVSIGLGLTLIYKRKHIKT